MKTLIVCALLLLAALAQAAMKDYSFSVVYRITMQNEDQINALFELEDQGKVDVWSEKMGLGVDVDIRLAPENHNDVVNRLFKELNTPHKIYIENVQTLIDEERMNLAKLPGFGANSAADDFFLKYRTADEFNAFLKTLNSQYPDLTELFSIGKTVHGNDINGIRITGKKAAGKPAVVYNGGQHAREWISPMVVAYIANELLSKYATDDTIKQLVEEIEWNLVPIVNVDGYLYTWSKDRLWRKNMRENPHCTCKGVDPNRNWGYMWNATGGSSTNCCSETYRGPAPFSEPESLAIATFANTTQNLKAYIDFHSYSQLWMRPWGFTTDAPKNEAVAKEIGDACALAIKNTHGVVYESGRISIIIYEASGSSVDFVYYYTDAISFGVELRDTGRYGFLLPPQQIVPTGEEVVAAAVRTIGTYILKHKI